MQETQTVAASSETTGQEQSTLGVDFRYVVVA